MTPTQFYGLIQEPAAIDVTPCNMPPATPQSHCLLLAVAGQESAWNNRIQVPGGQARGFWQCEQAGMLRGVMAGQPVPIRLICSVHCLPRVEATLFEAIAWHDLLAYSVARLALWMDPHPLPEIGDEDGAWEVYERVWRPGKPSRDRWSSVYPQAVAVING